MGICAEGKAYLPHRFKILLNCILRQYQKPPFLRLTGWLKGERPECGLHPLIHTSATSEASTKYRNSVSRGKVGIKVCNVHSVPEGERSC